MTDHRAINYDMLAAASEEFQRELSHPDCTTDEAEVLSGLIGDVLCYQRKLMQLEDIQIENRRLRRELAEMMDEEKQEEWDRANYGDAA